MKNYPQLALRARLTGWVFSTITTE